MARNRSGVADQDNPGLPTAMRIAIDIDSTLHDYWPLLSAAAKRRFGIELPYGEQFTWDVSRLRKEQLRACVADTHSDEAIAAAEPYPNAVAVVNRWGEAGHFVHITSHRAEHCHASTARWLERIGLRYDELYCSYDKIARCREIGIDVLIDDSPVNIVGALEAGMVAATLRHPWNDDVCAEEDVVCAADWPELERLLAPLLAGDRRPA
jgi:FMN phosphatase YigB (HAD superfamily)